MLRRRFPSTHTQLGFTSLAIACALWACSSAGTSTPGGLGGAGGKTASNGGASGVGVGGNSSAFSAGGAGGAASGGSPSAAGGTGGASTSGGASGVSTGGTAAGGSAGMDASIQDDGATDAADGKRDSARGDVATPFDAGSISACPTTLPALAADNDTSFYANNPSVPHGTVATVKYTSGAITAHIYTPPDYATNTNATYPVLYLNHGVGETDAVYACTTGGPECGYAGLILDNLIAAKKAVPMIMVMTDTRDCATLDPAKPPTDDPCTVHYRQVLMPYVEKNYRTKTDRNDRAIGGLSLGGVVTFNVGLSHLELFSQLFIYSSGFFPDAQATWEANMSAIFGDAKTTNHLLNVPIYMAAGDTDVALDNAKAVRDILKKHGIKVLWLQSSLGHEWTNWRRYLAQTLPLMFTNMGGCD